MCLCKIHCGPDERTIIRISMIRISSLHTRRVNVCFERVLDASLDAFLDAYDRVFLYIADLSTILAI